MVKAYTVTRINDNGSTTVLLECDGHFLQEDVPLKEQRVNTITDTETGEVSYSDYVVDFDVLIVERLNKFEEDLLAAEQASNDREAMATFAGVTLDQRIEVF